MSCPSAVGESLPVAECEEEEAGADEAEQNVPEQHEADQQRLTRCGARHDRAAPRADAAGGTAAEAGDAREAATATAADADAAAGDRAAVRDVQHFRFYRA